MLKRIISKARCSKEYLRLLGGYKRDFFRYAKYSCIGWNRGDLSELQLEGRIIANYHVLEKGLSMPEFRPLFGVPMVKRLIQLTKQGASKYNWNCNVNYLTAVAVIQKYMERHEQLSIDLSDSYSEEEINYGKELSCEVSVKSGSEDHGSVSYFSKSDSNFDDLAKSRHSCRVFKREVAIDITRIEEVVEIARFTPSVCNRQCWRVNVYDDKESIDDLLRIQNGNRGFGHTIPMIIAISCNLNVFDGYHERNQAYIDGGLFSMSLMYALQHKKLGAVPLCWLVDGRRDDEAREVGLIPENEVIIMLIGVGEPVEEFSAPASQRRQVEDIIRIKKS